MRMAKLNMLTTKWLWRIAFTFSIIAIAVGVKAYLHVHRFDFSGYTLKSVKTEAVNDVMTNIDYNCDKSKFIYTCAQLRTSQMTLVYHTQIIPLRIKECKLTNSKRKTKALVWIHGGPFVKMSEEVPPEQSAYLARGFTVIEPIYAGNLGNL
jgi:hypothetical protein